MGYSLIRFTFCFFLILTGLMLYSSPRAFAQDYGAAAYQRSNIFGLEITPMAGYTSGGSLEDIYSDIELKVKESGSYGLIIDIPNGYDSQFEFFFSHQPTALKIKEGPFAGDHLFDLDIQYFHIGGTYGPNTGGLDFYVAGGLGLTRMTPGIGDSETKFSLSVGAGLKMFLTDNIGIRVEGRGFGTFYGGSRAIFCRNGYCSIHIDGDLFWQFSVFSGVILRF